MREYIGTVVTIGLIAMSAKPYHAGHDGLIRLASKESDEVHVYVSLSDRRRAGETVPVLGSDMKKVWSELIEPTLPGNVHITYGGSPIGQVWQEIGAAGPDTSFRIYSTPEDLAQSFPENNLRKYGGDLFTTGRIILRPVQRSETTDVSGTGLRAALAAGDKVTFMRGMPGTIDGGKVWDVLSNTSRNAPKVKTTAKAMRKAPKVEALLRQCIRLHLQD